MTSGDEQANGVTGNQKPPERQPARVGTTRASTGGQTPRRIAKGVNKGINVFNGITRLAWAGLCLFGAILTIGHSLALPGLVFIAGTVWFLYQAWIWLTA